MRRSSPTTTREDNADGAATTTTTTVIGGRTAVSELSARFLQPPTRAPSSDSDGDSDTGGGRSGDRAAASEQPPNTPEELAHLRRVEADLWRRRSAHLAGFLSRRPHQHDLLAKNILSGRTPQMRAELRAKIENSLERRLSQRPSAVELEQKNILHRESTHPLWLFASIFPTKFSLFLLSLFILLGRLFSFFYFSYSSVSSSVSSSFSSPVFSL